MRVSENYRFESDSVVTRVRVAKKERKKEKKERNAAIEASFLLVIA